MKSLNVLKIKNFIGIIVSLMISSGLYAQVNFSGTWGLNESKSNFGNSEFRFAAVTMVITQEGNNLTVESTQPGPEGEMKMTYKYTLDGQPTENVVFMDMKRKSVVTWSDDKTSMLITSTMAFEGNEFKSSETWKLAADGTTINIDQVMPMPDGEMKIALVYDKK